MCLCRWCNVHIMQCHRSVDRTKNFLISYNKQIGILAIHLIDNMREAMLLDWDVVIWCCIVLAVQVIHFTLLLRMTNNVISSFKLAFPTDFPLAVFRVACFVMLIVTFSSLYIYCYAYKFTPDHLSCQFVTHYNRSHKTSDRCARPTADHITSKHGSCPKAPLHDVKTIPSSPRMLAYF